MKHPILVSLVLGSAPLFATAKDEAPTEPPVCSTQGGLKLCVDQATILPLQGKYRATVTLTFTESLKGFDTYSVLLPMVHPVLLDVGGMSEWRLASTTGAKGCNSSSDSGCIELSKDFTKINIGGGPTFVLIAPQTTDVGAALAGATKGIITVRLLIGPEGQAIHSETFKISGFPVSVRTAPGR